MLPVAALITACAMVALSFLGSANGAVLMVVLFAMMGLVDLSASGALIISVPVLKWFVRERGKAIAFTGLGIPIGALNFVPLTQMFIDWWGWETAWVVPAAIVAGVIVPLAAIFVRRQPEDIGLLPDGDSPRKPSDKAAEVANGREPQPVPSADDEVSWTVREARRSPAFWSLTVVFSIVTLAIGTVALHRIPDFADRGFNTTLIANATAIGAVFAGVATFVFGRLVKYLHVRILGALGFSLLAIASVMTIYATRRYTRRIISSCSARCPCSAAA